MRANHSLEGFHCFFRTVFLDEAYYYIEDYYAENHCCVCCFAEDVGNDACYYQNNDHQVEDFFEKLNQPVFFCFCSYYVVAEFFEVC